MPSARSSSTLVAWECTDDVCPGGCHWRVRRRLLEEVVTEVAPDPLGVFGDERHRGVLGRHGAEALRAELGALLVVVGLELGQVRGRQVRQAEPRRAAHRDLARAAEHQRGVRLGERARRDPHRGAAVLERLTGPRLEHGVDRLVLQRAAALPVLAVRLVLALAVADAGGDDEPTAAGEVEHRDVLGQAERVVQRREERVERGHDPLRAAEDQPRHDQRRRAPPVVGAVVLLQRDGLQAVRRRRRPPCRRTPGSATTSRPARARAGCS